MRFRDLFALAIIGICTWYFARLPHAGLGSLVPVAAEVNRSDADRSNAIELQRDDWVTFQIPETANAIRLLTNAALQDPELPATTQTDPRTGWRYAIEYQLLDLAGQQIDEAAYHFRSRVEPMMDVETGKPVYPMFFEDSTVATQTRVMQVGLKSFSNPKPALVRVRFKSADENIESVAARVLSQIERHDAHERTTWNRLTRKRRDEICKYCVYDSDLLGFSERASLMRWRWVSSPTVGEFEPRPIYSISELDDGAVVNLELPAGKFAAANWTSSIPVPSEKGDVRLEFIPPTGQPLENFSAHVNWFGNHLQDHLELKSDAAGCALEGISNGLIQLTTNQECVIRAYWRPTSQTTSETVALWMSQQSDNENGEYEITPEAIKIRAYLADQTKIAFSVSHQHGRPTPFRIAVRKIFDDEFFANTESESTSRLQDSQFLNWEFLDQTGAVIDSGEIKVDDLVTRYDHLKINKRQILLSDGQPVFFSIPTAVKTIRFGSERNAFLVNGYVRPAEMERYTRVPEDYSPFDRQELKTRSWFTVNPIDADALFQDNRAFIVNTQPLAPEIDPLVLLGQYDWQRYVPQGKWIGREILVPLPEQHQSNRNELLQAMFGEIQRNKSYEISRLDVEMQPKSMRIILAAPDSPGNVIIKVDSQVIYQRRHASSRGTIELPIPKDLSESALLNVSTENSCRLFINGIDTGSTKTFLKQTAQRLRRSQLEFEYEKKSLVKELLTMRLFRSSHLNQRCKIRVLIEPETSTPVARTNPAEGWTIGNRLYDLRAVNELPSMLLDTDASVDAGYRCFINLDNDMPVGKYKIKVECLDDADAYVLMYQIIPGRAPKRRIRSVPQTTHVVDKMISTRADFDYQPGLNRSERSNTSSDSFVEKPALVQPPTRPPTQLYKTLRELVSAKNEVTDVSQATANELQQVEQLFRETAQATDISSEFHERWNQLGWDLIELQEFGIVVIRESENQRFGRGVYAIRLRCNSNTILQAPHRFFDERTGAITRKLFVENEIYAAAWNTSHRKQIDLAHEQRHHFNSFMNALADQQTRIIQLHGFESETRADRIKNTDIILSDSTRFPGRHALQTTVRLKEILGPEAVRLFPLEINELGGTKNAQAALLRSTGTHQFLHVELDADYRKELANTASKRVEFIQALLDFDRNHDKQPKP